MSWLADQRAELATDRILDAAGDLFLAQGVSKVSMGQVAGAAGCSRATLYRYFSDRHELHVAFAHREARRAGAQVLTEVAMIEDPEPRLVAAVSSAVRLVRETPLLAVWFEAGDAAATADLVRSSEVLESLAGVMSTDTAAARWLVRVVVSLLFMPGRDEAEERELVARFVAPAVLGRVQGPPQGLG